jgi:hypothetical protein
MAYISGATLGANIPVVLSSGKVIAATGATAPILGFTQHSSVLDQNVTLWPEGSEITVETNASLDPGVPVTATTAGVVATAAALTGAGARYTCGYVTRTISSTRAIIRTAYGFHPADAP